MKDWKTTSIGIFATLLMIVGMFKPEVMDEETQELAKQSFDYILIAVGSVINLINSIKAKDPS